MHQVRVERLEELGWTPERQADFAAHAAAGLVPARVAVEHRNRYELWAEGLEVEGVLAGRLRHGAGGRLDLPAVGDWVALQPPAGGGAGVIAAVLPRTSLFTRKVAGRGHGEQIVAANVDVVFIITSLTAELNPRRLERYLTLAWESGARPVVVLSKADICRDVEARRREVEGVVVGVPVLVISARRGDGVGDLLADLSGHRTGALLGSSGVGKSTLVNTLLGYERQVTAEVRESDGRGRHVTTRRELIPLPGGGLLIDTPGMRELQLAEAGHGLVAAFDDIERLAEGCGFRDCTHGPEPDCAVKAAAAGGRLEAARLAAYHKLAAELAHHERQASRGAEQREKSRTKAATRALREQVKRKRS